MDEARIEDNDEGRLPVGEGWFILNGASVKRTTGRDTEAYGDLPAEVRTPPPPPFRR